MPEPSSSPAEFPEEDAAVGDPPFDGARLALSDATARALELPSLLDLIGELAATDLGSERIRALVPLADVDRIEARRLRFQEARRLVAGSPLVPSSDGPIGPVLEALSGTSRELRGRDLVELASALDVAERARRRILEADPACPALGEDAERLADLRELLGLLRRTFDGRGEIREDATPRLAELRGRIRSSRQRIYDQMGSLVEQHRDHLSEETIPMRGGRLVMMLQSGARGRVPGLVHGRSGSGRSFYFEPLEAVESNNQLQQAVEDEEAEKRRIFREVVDRIRAEIGPIRDHADFVADLDLLQAAVRFAESTGGTLAELSDRHELELTRARHPLLDPRLAELRRRALGKEGHTGEVVPLDVSLDAEQRALVVTGPNAGGKTVALKTVGLCCLIHQCGLPVPAEKGSRLPVLDALVATVGDDQDLLADRSTFSGRLLRLAEAWDLASPDSLVLLDELGSGTDPEEGAALSTALLEGLLERQGLVIVTTHLAQVAAAALDAEGAFCAAMQFDTGSGEPTYRLVPGPPGGSEALALAQRLGLPSAWLDRAEALLGSDHRDLRNLLAEVDRHRRELTETRERLATELHDAELLRQRLARRETELAEEKRNLGKKMKRELEAFRRQTLESLRDEVGRLEKELDRGRRKGLAAAATERLFEKAPEIPEAEAEESTVPVREGGQVRHRRLGWTGKLEKLEKGRAQVLVQGKSILCREKDLVGVDPKTPARASSETTRASRGQGRARGFAGGRGLEPASDRPGGGATPRAELMLVGQRVEPALERLDRFLDKALVDSLSAVRIIHGYGSGRLRDAVRDLLSRHRAVLRHRPGEENEGGDGATVAILDE